MRKIYMFLMVSIVALLGAMSSNGQTIEQYGTLLDSVYYPQAEGDTISFDVKAGVEDEMSTDDTITFVLTDINKTADNIALYCKEGGAVTAPYMEVVTDGGTVTLPVLEDTYADGNKPDANKNDDSKFRLMVCSSSPERESFLKFDLSTVTGTVTSATLKLMRLTATSTSKPNNYVGAYYIHSDNWDETTLTYNNRYDGITGNHEIMAAEMGLKVYPNPTNGAFTVDGSGIAGKSVSLSIVDMRGVVLFSKEISGMTTLNSDRSFSPGLYFVRVQSGNNIGVKKLIVR